MAQQATVSTRLDAAAIREVAGWRDPSGILSVYVDAHGDRLVGNPPPVARSTKNALDELARSMNGGVKRALDERLRELGPTLHLMLDPRAHGMGRALFATIEGGEIRAFAVQLPLPDLVTFAPRPRLRPLLRAEAIGRPAGLVLVGGHGVRFVDWRFGEASELGDFDIPDARDVWEDRPPHGRGAITPNAGDTKDMRHRRASAWVAEALAAATGRLGVIAAERGWADIVLAGDVHLVTQFAESLPPGVPDVILDTRTLEWQGAAAAAAVLVPVLHDARDERARTLLHEARDLAAAGGRGAARERDVVAALALGRVEHLFVDVAAPGADGDLDELVALAVETDAAITALESLTADGSGYAAAAILRW